MSRPSASTPKPRGGRRPGAGRPKGQPTRVLSFRVPAELLDSIQAQHPPAFVRGYLLAALRTLRGR